MNDQKNTKTGIRLFRRLMRRSFFLMLFWNIFSSQMACAADHKIGLSGKVIMGYQGWFGCPGDFEKNNSWQHWFLGSAQSNHFTVDLLPSVRGIKAEDLCDTGLRRPDNSPIQLFSSQNASVVATHFRWMQEHGIDGVAVQRFLTDLATPEKKRRNDNVVKNVQKAAEANGRVFYVTYDITGANPKTVTDDVRNDWHHLVDVLKITESPSYLLDRRKPVLQLWGFGFDNRPGEADEVAVLIGDLKSGRGDLQAVTLIGGVPTFWRTLSGDSKKDPTWADVYRSYDVISPWSVGRFSNDEEADAFVKRNVVPDIAETRRLGVGYMPVIFAGFSRYNLTVNYKRKEPTVLNKTPRNCGKFLWHQVSDLLDLHVDMLYAAMFDEVDEGTALFPAETRQDKLPVGASMVFLNQDGCSLPDDWYLRVTGKAAEYLRLHQPPPKNLDAVLKP
ncbi:hypothetical protein SAMN04515618_112126 [Collimonas sp. OK307]|uniref:glycoside hydrolase family 71/99-like protein n=1 Tax=Collimonas sp. OK307 TaxID=1801620 RepID=UPI0008DECE2B|nr:glycoside hydrolase family 71/99-like protein [Collimonas sp. OK307]SFI17797.1 hypothetical protein SAMN04515618_112126 [Collimonas sp. OK307]